MRDPELVVRAQLAASSLEEAWHRWRAAHGHATDPMPAVSSYVGYSLQEPYGQPRVVIGLAAEEAEQLATLLERQHRAEPAYAAVSTQPAMRDRPARATSLAAPLPVPMQAPSVAASIPVSRSRADVLLAADQPGYDEPVYRQAAAAMREAAAAREIASRAKAGGAESVYPQVPRDNRAPAEDLAASIDASDRSSLADLVDPAWMGSLAMAAFTARTEAEARIRAALTKSRAEGAHRSELDDDAGEYLAAPVGPAGVDDAGEYLAAPVGPAGVDDAGEYLAASVGPAGVDAGADELAAAAPDGDVASADEAVGDAVDDIQAVADGDDHNADGERGGPGLPQIHATDVLDPLPAPEAAEPGSPSDAESAGALGQDSLDEDVIGPDAVELDSGSPDAVGPDAVAGGAASPDAAVAGAARPDAAGPDAAVAEAAGPDAVAGGAASPDAVVAGAARPDADDPDGVGVDADGSDAAGPYAAGPDAAVADPARPNAEGQDAAVAEAAGPDAEGQDAVVADAVSPDAVSPDAVSPDADDPDGVGVDAGSPDVVVRDGATPDGAELDGAGPDAIDHDPVDRDGAHLAIDSDVIDREAVDRGPADSGAVDQEVYEAPGRGSQDVVPGLRSVGPSGGTARRGRVTRSYPIARLSKTKRPGASSQAAGG